MINFKLFLKAIYTILIFCTTISFSQEVISVRSVPEDSEDIEFPLAVMESIPEFKACEDVEKKESMICFNQQMTSHVQKNLVYPEEARNQDIQGRVTVLFVIDKEGNITNVRARGPRNGELLEQEAIRIVKMLPQFKPGVQKGKPVNVSYALPINFKLDAPATEGKK